MIFLFLFKFVVVVVFVFVVVGCVQVLVVVFMLIVFGVVLVVGKVGVFWFGQLVFKIIMLIGKVIVIDLWFIVNLKMFVQYKKFEVFGKVDLIFVMYGYGDYYFDVLVIVKMYNVLLWVLVGFV